jgi:hypothetical protein
MSIAHQKPTQQPFRYLPHLQLRLDPKALLDCLHRAPRNVIVLTRQSRTTSHRPHYHSILYNRHPTRDGHESSAIAVIDTVRRSAWPYSLLVNRRRRAMASCCIRLVDGDVDGCVFCAFHSREGEKMARVVYDGDVHGYFYFFGARFCGGERDARAIKR